MKTIRHFISLVVICSLLVLTVACGKNETIKETAKQDAANPVTQEESQSVAASLETNKEKITVVFQTWNPDEPAFKVLQEDMKVHLPDIDVKLQFVPYSDHIQKLKIDLQSGAGPDVFGLQTGAPMKEFQPFLEEVSQSAQAAWGERWAEKFSEYGMNLIKGKLDGYYGLPLGMTYAGTVWANQKYFNNLNLSLPTDLKSLKAVCEAFRKAGDYPLASGAKDDWINLDMFMSIMNDLNPQALYAAIEGEQSWENKDCETALNIWKSFFAEGIYQDGALGVNMYSDTVTLFEQDASVPMITNGSWVIGNYLKTDPAFVSVWGPNNKDAKEVLALDWNEDGKAAPLTTSVDVVICQNKNTKHPKESWQFMEYMATRGADILVNDLLFYFPAKRDAQFTGKLSDEGLHNFNQLMTLSKNVAGYREIPYPELKQAIADELKAVATNEHSPQEAAAAIQKVSASISR